MINISIVTVLYNHTQEHVDYWLENLLKLFYYLKTYNIEIILINNNSDTIYNFDKYLDNYKIRYTNLSENLGYCGGNNFGINLSLNDYILILNPDVYIKNSLVIDWLYSALQFNFGISGMYRDGINWLTYPAMFPTISKFENEKLPFCYNENPLSSNLKSLKWKSLPFIDGCIMMFPKSIFSKVSFDDNIFPGYFGENTFQFKCQLEFPNFKLINVPIEKYIIHDSKSDSAYSLESKIDWTEKSREYFYKTYVLPNYDFFLSKLV